jgi:hypothetical protein
MRSPEEIIGSQGAADYVFDLDAHPALYRQSAPALARALEASRIRAIVEGYRQSDLAAVAAQAAYKGGMNRANLAVLGAAAFGALMMAAQIVLEGRPFTPYVIGGLGLLSAISGALAAMWLHGVNAGSLLNRWMQARATAETQRLSYFSTLVAARPAGIRDVELDLLKLEYFRRYQLELQRRFFSARGAVHERAASRTLTLASVAVAGASVASLVSGAAGALAGVATGLGVLGVFAAALSTYANAREAISQDRRNAERYRRTDEALLALSGRLDEVRAAVARGNHQALVEFVAAVNEQVSLEHRQWLDAAEATKEATAKLDEALTTLHPLPVEAASAQDGALADGRVSGGYPSAPVSRFDPLSVGEESSEITIVPRFPPQPPLFEPPAPTMATPAGSVPLPPLAHVPPTGSAAPQPGEAAPPVRPVSSPADFSVVAPPLVTPERTFFVQVWIAPTDQREAMLEQATRPGRMVEVGKRLRVNLATDTLITVVLDLPDFQIDDAVEVLPWTGEINNVDFKVTVPVNLAPGMYPGLAKLLRDKIAFASIYFDLVVAADAPVETPPLVLPSYVQQITRAFASYASPDRGEVLRRVQGMRALGTEVFVDILNFRAGQEWEPALDREIRASDGFFLFWSRHARESQWVEKEWRYALRQRGKAFINPVPLEDPRLAAPPADLADKHFNDMILAFIKNEEAVKAELAKPGPP